MALADDVSRMRADSLAALDASHDYYEHTRSVWRIIQQLVREGHVVTIRNQATGNTVDKNELPGLAQKYVTGYLAAATFQHFVSLFEDFVFDFTRAWLVEYPRSLSAKQVAFRIVLDSADKPEIIRTVVQKELVEVAYGRVEDWFENLEKIAKLGCPSPEEVERLAEIKASRDVLVHNKGIANSIYVDKSSGRARFREGETLTIPEGYHRDSWRLIRQVVADIADAALKKLGK